MRFLADLRRYFKFIRGSLYIRLADSSGGTAFVLISASGDEIVRIRSDGEITGSWILGSQGGALEAGNDNVTIDYDGLRLVAPTAQNDRASIRFYAEEYNGSASYIRQDSGSDTGYADLFHLYTVLGSSGINLTSVRYQYYTGGSWYDGSLKIRMESVNPTAGKTGSYIELYGFRDASAQYGVIVTPSEDATVGIKLNGDTDVVGDMRASAFTSGWLPFVTAAGHWNISAQSLAFIASVGFTGTIDYWHQAAYVSTGNDSSNYWTINLDISADGTTWTNVASIDTKALSSATTWTHLSTTGIDYDIDSSDIVIRVQATPTGSPGNLWLSCPAVYVI